MTTLTDSTLRAQYEQRLGELLRVAATITERRPSLQSVTTPEDIRLLCEAIARRDVYGKTYPTKKVRKTHGPE